MIHIIALYYAEGTIPWYFELFYFLLLLFLLLLPFLIRYVILRRPVINLWSAILLAFICGSFVGTSLCELFMAEEELSNFERYVLSDPEFLKEELSDFHRYLLSDPKETGRPNLESLWYKYRLKEEIKQKEEKLKQKRENFRPFIMPIFVAALVYAYCIMHVGYRDYCIKRLIADETDKKPKDEQKE